MKFMLPSGSHVPIIYGYETAYLYKTKKDLYTVAKTPGKALANIKSRLGFLLQERPSSIGIGICDLYRVDI